MNILQVQNISKSFDGIKAVDNLAFNIEKGTITALIGPNGSGKTVTFSLITGFYKLSSGKIFFNDKDITSLAPHKIFHLGIGRTFQNIRLFSQMTALDNVLLGIQYKKGENLVSAIFKTKAMMKEDRENREKAIELLKMVGIENKHNHLADTLSYGQRKLVEIARTFGTDSMVYLFDEPTAGVFPNTVQKLLFLIQSLKEKGKTILFIEHNMKVVMDISDKIIVLNYGKKIAEGKPYEVQNNDAVIEAYMGKGRKIDIGS